MPTYVDPAVWKWRGRFWCHLAADSLDELHRFAKKLGLREEWFQDKNPRYPHYDLADTTRSKAVKLGAVELTSRELLAKTKLLAIEYAILRPKRVPAMRLAPSQRAGHGRVGNRRHPEADSPRDA